MLNYFDIIETISEIVENNKIQKKGLVLLYELDSHNHLKLNEDIYTRLNKTIDGFKPTETFELELGGITVKFIKKENV